MEILLDQQNTAIEESSVNNLEEILVKVMSDLIRPGQVITTVKLNGEVYSEENPHDAVRISLSDIETLEIHTMATDEIAWRFLDSGVEQVDMIIQGAQKISELFRIADETEANEQYADFLESLRLFLQMVAEVKAILNLDLASAFKGRTVEDRVEKLSEMMDQMLHVQEEEDWIMLADLLEYELIPLLEEWKSILPLLKGKKGN
jgi:hypothetical protein